MCVWGGCFGGKWMSLHSIFFVLLGQRRGVKKDAGVKRLFGGGKMDANGPFLRLILSCTGCTNTTVDS